MILRIKEKCRLMYQQFKYGKYSHWRYMMAEDAVEEKVPVINKLFSMKERRKCFMRGFNSDKLIWYDKDKMNEGNYIDDFEHYTLFEKIDLKQYYIADDKLVCERMLAPFCKTIPTIGYIVVGKYYPIGNDADIVSYEAFVEHVRAGEEFYIKPNFGGSGRGIGRLTWKEGNYWWNDKQIDDIHAFIKTFKDGKGYLVQRRFVQTGFSHDVNPDTLNTIRVVTMLSPETGMPFVAWSFHRFGRKGHFVDNVAAGNMLCPIDPKTGIMQYGILPPIEGKVIRVGKHPDTGVVLENIAIPHWEEIKDLCFRLALQVPFMPLCGWDIILSDDELTMQELNYNPDIYAGQILYPLLEDLRVKSFYNYYKEKYNDNN